MSESRGISPWWALLILPVAGAVGWSIGQVPPPKLPEPKPAVATTEAPAPPKQAEVVAPPPPRSAMRKPEDETPAPARTPAEPKTEQRPEISSWTSLEIAMLDSERSGKPVMIDFNAEWCGPCRRMKEEVFENGELGRTVQTAVIPVSIVDRRREEGQNTPQIESLQQKFQITAFPTLVVFSPATGRVVMTKGYGGAEATTGWIVNAAKAVR